MIEVRMINEARKADINLPNEPFGLFGRMEPPTRTADGDDKETLYNEENISEMCFPDEDYDYEAMKENSVFLGAYDGEKCVGLAILQEAFLSTCTSMI